mmetsp:Transcript_27704/g.42443  ORF Transcript_27704/g.42443 Transcript_27704/m.42443 type:complete len:87 (-) Transcript_27704:216-476(-)
MDTLALSDDDDDDDDDFRFASDDLSSVDAVVDVGGREARAKLMTSCSAPPMPRSRWRNTMWRAGCEFECECETLALLSALLSSPST